MENPIMNKKKMRKILYVFIAIILALVFSSRTLYNFSLPRVTVAMAQNGWITKELEVRGLVEFSETFDIFSPSSGWLDEIFINRGDFIDTDTIIASYNPQTANEQAHTSLLTSMERTEHQLLRLNIQREDIQSNLRALSATSPDEIIQLQWAVDDAVSNLEDQYAELAHIQQQLANSMEGAFLHINPTTNTERNWNRHVTELNQAQTALYELKAQGTIFDGFTYKQAIQEASITLERSATDLQNAESALTDARRLTADTFDPRNYQNAINTAQTNRQRSRLAYDSAHRQLNTAWHNLHALGAYADISEMNAAYAAINEAQSQVELARMTLDENSTAVDQASDNLQRARTAFNAQDGEQRNQEIKNAETLATQAENAFKDATRAYENALALLTRAEDAAITRWQNEINEAEKRISDALMALDESTWGISQNLKLAESNLANAYQTLERAKRNLDLAQNAQTTQTNHTRHTLEIELRNIDLDIERTLIDLRADQSSLTAMYNTHTSTIMANRQGIVVSVDKRDGQFVSQGERIATIGVANNRFMVEFSIPGADADFIEIGSEANIYRSGSNIGIRSFVYDMTLVGDNINIQVISETDQFSGGELARVRFRKQTGLHQTIVPNEAIFAGPMGQHYIWIVQNRPGALGTEYISVRRNVRIIDSDDFNTAVYMGFMMMDMPVVTSYNRALSVNGRVSRME